MWATHSAFTAIADIQLNKFVRLDNMPGVVENPCPYLVALNVQPCLSFKDITVQTPVDFGLTKVYYLSTFGMQFGYLFEMPRLVLHVEHNYISIVRPKHKKAEQFTGATVQFSNAHFMVLNAQDQALLITRTMGAFDE